MKDRRMTLEQIFSKMREHVKTHPYALCNDKPLTAIIVFNPEKSGWKNKDDGYSLESRSYKISSGNKFFDGNCIGNSLFAYCVDKNEFDSLGIRLDYYLDTWVADYGYFV